MRSVNHVPDDGRSRRVPPLYPSCASAAYILPHDSASHKLASGNSHERQHAVHPSYPLKYLHPFTLKGVAGPVGAYRLSPSGALDCEAMLAVLGRLLGGDAARVEGVAGRLP